MCADVLGGLPEKYDPDDLEVALRDLVDQAMAEREPATALPSVAGSGGRERDFSLPSYDTVRSVSLTRPLSGTVGGDDDPRIAVVSATEGSGASGGFQRFRFERGLSLPPFFGFPANGAPIPPPGTDVPVAFATLVVGIPHSLGRLPEFVVARASADRRGPVTQRVEVQGGDAANSLSGAFSLGDEIRAEVDFIPILGRRRADVEHQVKMLLNLVGGVGSWGFEDVPLGSSDFELPAIRNSVLGEMVTTDEVFSGMLWASSWGFEAAWCGDGEWTGAAPTWNAILHRTRSSVAPNHPAGMAGLLLGDVAKSPWLMGVPKWAGAGTTIQDMIDDGLRVGLQSGSVDFIVR